MTNKVVLDTNVLLDNPEIINKYNCVILSHVIRELENHKLSSNTSLAYKARNAIRAIESNISNIQFDFNDYFVLLANLDNGYTDNKILQACIINKYDLITNDLLLKYKAIGNGVNVIEFEEDGHDYTGYKEVKLDDAELAAFYENLTVNTYDLLVNQYLIIRNQDGLVIDKLRWNGNEHVKLKHVSSKVIKPVNELQDCAIDLLLNEAIPIKIIAGNYGSGKTLLSVKIALYHIEKGNYSRIMVVRNPIGTGEEIGFLKGTKDDKTRDFFNPFIQHLDGGEQEAFFLEQRGILVKEIPFYMKGLSIDNTIIICDEAEDLSIKLFKLIGTRLGKNSAVVFSGDYQQAEDKFVHNNGLLEGIRKLKGNPLAGILVLKDDVRSEASKVFAEL